MDELPITNLVFERDGTLPADVLETLPADLRARVTSPDFIAQARAAIHKAMQADRGVHKTGRRESRIPLIGIHSFGNRPNRKARRAMQAALRG